MKILLAVDGSPCSKKMLAYLGTHETLLSSFNNYTVFHAQPALPPRARAAVGKAIVDGYYTEESEKVLAPVAKFLFCATTLMPSRSGKVGPAGATIAKMASDGKFDLVANRVRTATALW